MFPPYSDPYSAAFSHWKHVQEQLAQTIQDYVDACATLQSALAIYPKDFSSRNLHAKACAGLNSQLPFLASYEQSLEGARFSLNTTRNTSHNLTPVNSLPPEILNIIFIMAAWQKKDAVCAITGVCKLWRQTTLGCPGCWSQIELPIGPSSDWLAITRAELWAKRAQNEPLYISVWERPHRLEDPWYSPNKTYGVVRFLTALMPRVHAMDFLDDNLDLNDLVPATLACWAEHGTVGTAKVLRVHAGTYEDLVQIRAKDIGAGSQFKSFFSSLRTLSLRNTVIDRGLGLYSGLVDLRLSHVRGRRPYSRRDIAEILAASPGLQSLALGIAIGVDRREDALDTVALNGLHLLHLTSSGRNQWAVLRMITSTSDSIRVCLSSDDHPEFIPAARSFFERCKVTALHINSPYYKPRPSMSSLFVHMPHLQRLAIENSSIIDQTWRSSISPDSNSLDLWPRLDEIYVNNCQLDQHALPLLLSIHGPKNLWVHEPRWDGQARDQAKERLRQYGVKLVWVESRDNTPAGFREFVLD
ncbi:hypothetical protein FRC06_005812 [Ceratobasidium sp. 370]|nr:hypothetical protein FRC06_005812 [Ceratobasidium sp. 370]